MSGLISSFFFIHNSRLISSFTENRFLRLWQKPEMRFSNLSCQILFIIFLWWFSPLFSADLDGNLNWDSPSSACMDFVFKFFMVILTPVYCRLKLKLVLRFTKLYQHRFSCIVFYGDSHPSNCTLFSCCHLFMMDLF